MENCKDFDMDEILQFWEDYGKGIEPLDLTGPPVTVKEDW